MVRLVFRPYTQIRRTICTSVSLRASTRVSPGFTLFRHRSPSFGSQQICSYSNLSQVTIGRQCLPVTGFLPQQHKPAFTFITHQGFPPKYSHICQTPWSVFQDGSMETISSGSRWHIECTTPSTRIPQHSITLFSKQLDTSGTQDQAVSGAPLLPQSKPWQSDRTITEIAADPTFLTSFLPQIRIDSDCTQSLQDPPTTISDRRSQGLTHYYTLDLAEPVKYDTSI